MKKLFILLFSLVVYTVAQSQNLKYVIFSAGADLSSLSFITDQKVIIKISQDGNVLEWGNEQ